ncbi:hypothetical protein K431DRAFT_292413 [Polychaeton citri CBS 116435]|uniref:Uncharacterized protein n=1 Tax=Polychaeton citri CBS 116435 TaxID=1314669 RepID=A0A9P4USG5_9PEZI|nr:hypothetical protein K431DRAFT_292413 [Polychaeton citri CBS 116435]
MQPGLNLKNSGKLRQLAICPSAWYRASQTLPTNDASSTPKKSQDIINKVLIREEGIKRWNKKKLKTLNIPKGMITVKSTSYGFLTSLSAGANAPVFKTLDKACKYLRDGHDKMLCGQVVECERMLAHGSITTQGAMPIQKREDIMETLTRIIRHANRLLSAMTRCSETNGTASPIALDPISGVTNTHN